MEARSTPFRGSAVWLQARASSGLKRLARPGLRFGSRSISSFHLCGIVGWVTGIALACFLTAHQGLPLWVTGVLAVGSIVTFLALVMAMKIATGEENIVYYHHEIAVVAVSALTLWLLGQPVLPYLDAVLLGLGLFLACGRVGCLMVGCCHGRPHSWGVCYGHEHAAAGFTPHLVGVRLFPIQLVESVYVLATVAVGTAMVLRGAAPGSALAFYSIAYGLARFSFEFFRGDAARPYLRGFSEAQWTTLGLMIGTAAAELAGFLPLAWWHVGAAAALAVAMVFVGLGENRQRALFRARHMEQLAALAQAASQEAGAGGAVAIGQTELGIQLSASRVHEEAGELEVLGFSSPREPLPDRATSRLTRLLARLRRVERPERVLASSGGVVHLVLPAPAAGAESP